MRPDLPWNIAGISTEAREAARAAARREGLSVGEWLSRRIVSSISDTSYSHRDYGGHEFAGSSGPEFADMSASRSDWPSRNDFRIEPDRQRRDSDAMLDRVSKSEADTAEVYRRIEDQLRKQLQTDVDIQQQLAGERGIVRISFYSADDLERLLDLVLGKTRHDFD